MYETLYAIQYNNNGMPQAIGTITKDVYDMIYDDLNNATTVINKKTKIMEKTLYTDNYTIYKLARQLHRVSL